MEDYEHEWEDDEMVEVEDIDPSLYTLDVSDTLNELETD
jgi:hypothetical protein